MNARSNHPRSDAAAARWKKRFSGLALASLLGGASLIASGASGCSSDDDASGEAADASIDGPEFDADPCSSYTGVGKTCSLQPTRICFPQCQTGGCFCQNGVWACRTDFSCYTDATPLDETDAGDQDAGADATIAPDQDASDASNDAGDAADAEGVDAAGDLDASDAATDAPEDADDAG
jgi:hypothetical protein